MQKASQADKEFEAKIGSNEYTYKKAYW